MTATGPTWTQARLRRVLELRFGVTARGTLDLTAAAAGLGVTPATVRRWLGTGHGRALAPIPAQRLPQIAEVLAPSADVVADEVKAAAYARRAIDQLALPQGRGTLPAWVDKGWTTPHLVAVLAIRRARIRQIVVARATAKAPDDLAKRGPVVDFVVAPSWFHAGVLVHEVLTAVGPWRFQAHPTDVKAGRTRAWLDDAPAVDLAATANRLGLR